MFERDISSELSLEVLFGNGEMFVPQRATVGGCCSMSPKQPHEGKLRQKELKGEAKLWVRKVLEQPGNNITMVTIFPFLVFLQEGSGWFISAFIHLV